MTDTQLVEYSVTEAQIAKLGDIYLDLTIDNLKDLEQFEAVTTARKVMKSHRVAVQNEEKALKADANAWRKKVGDRAKEIYAKIYPIENHLIEEEQKVKDEEARIQAEEAARQQKIVDDRILQLRAVDSDLPSRSYMEVATMTDEEFDTALFDATEEYKHRKEAEEKEAARLKSEREEQERIRAENEKEARRLAAEKVKQEAEARAKQDAIDSANRIEREKLAAERKAFEEKQAATERLEREKREAEEARIREEQRKKDEAEAKAKAQVERDEARAKETKRIEEMRPDAEKMRLYFYALQEIPEPELTTEWGIDGMKIFQHNLKEYISTAMHMVGVDTKA